MTDAAQPPVLQLRVVIEAEDYERAVAFYRDALGMPELMAYAEGGDDRVTILEAGRATIEIANPTHKRVIDEIEADGRPSQRIRLAFEVTDGAGTTRRLAEAGASVVAEPVETPWRSLNSRLDAPAGLQITVFEELEDSEERALRDGFDTEADRG
ncbi:VOC family protein [Agromyces laixinhei]|uniref:VOC family protein n=1 Tax=Agromyces laixinhei TaxID=2585717 RepID=UPI0011179057|nr:VOC family protein [Agromyces laixinhei]